MTGCPGGGVRAYPSEALHGCMPNRACGQQTKTLWVSTSRRVGVQPQWDSERTQETADHKLKHGQMPDGSEWPYLHILACTHSVLLAFMSRITIYLMPSATLAASASVAGAVLTLFHTALGRNLTKFSFRATLIPIVAMLYCVKYVSSTLTTLAATMWQCDCGRTRSSLAFHRAGSS